METLMREWATILKNECANLSRNIEMLGGENRLTYLPAVARFSASSWALEKVSASWIKDLQESKRMQEQFHSYSNNLAQLIEQPAAGVGLNEAEIDTLMRTPRRTGKYTGPEPLQTPRQSGWTTEEVVAYAVLTRAYKEHFINCLSRKELLEGEDLRPHLEKLRHPDEHIRRREIYTLGEIGNVNTLGALLDALQPEVNTSLYGFAHSPTADVTWAGEGILHTIAEITLANATDDRVLKCLPTVIDIARHGHIGHSEALRSFMNIAWGNPKHPQILDNLQLLTDYFYDNIGGGRIIEAAKMADNIYKPIVDANPGDPRVIAQIPKLFEVIERIKASIPIPFNGGPLDPSLMGDSISAVTDLITRIYQVNPGNTDALAHIPRIMQSFDPQNYMYRKMLIIPALQIWAAAVEANPTNKDPLTYLPQVADQFKERLQEYDREEYAPREALTALKTAARIHPHDPKIKKYLPTAKKAAEKTGINWDTN